MLEIKEILGELSSLTGPSGFEERVGTRAGGLLAPYVDSVTVDALGNVFGFRACGRPGAKKLMLMAHLDEIGFIVTKIEDGFLRFHTLGGIDPRVLPAREVTVLADPPLHGVVTCLPPHLQTSEEMEAPTELSKLYIDVGLSQERAAALIPIGTPVAFSEKCAPLGTSLFSGKTLDDRACFVILLRTLELLKERPLPVDLLVVGSVQEELGHRGAVAAAFSHYPDYAVAVDVTHGDTPDGPKERTFKLGGGPPISLGPNTCRRFAKRLMLTAESLGIPYQTEVMEGPTGTDAWDIQVAREGVATVIVSLPLRYMHTAVEVVDLNDIESAARLLSAFTLSLEGGEL